ncbi:MAG: phage/plasmid primase, P4 family [Pseudomonadales bacterium]
MTSAPAIERLAKYQESHADNSPAFSEDALGREFTRRHGDDLRYVAGWGRWLMWDGTHWAFDETMRSFDLARDVCRKAAQECNKGAKQVASAKTVAAVEKLAKADRQHAATVDQWDADPWLLNTPGGVVDLRTGETRENRRGDYCSKVTAVARGGKCSEWLEFLKRITGGDDELQNFLKRVTGYGLTGLTREHALFFLYGTGANGKSTFVNAVAGVAGDYHVTSGMETFTASNTDRHPTELAALRGARLVTATETEEGRRWAESRIKQLTGGDPIAARFMRQDLFEFVPQFKLVIAGNHKPQLRNVDEAMRRRLHLVPFTVTIPEDERDEQLGESLKAEWPGILDWMIEGAVEWGMMGLQPPAGVRDATREYLSAEDALATWIEDRCHEGPDFKTRTPELFASWKLWAEKAGEEVGSMKRFSQRLEARGYEKFTFHGGGKGFRSLSPMVNYETNDGASGDPW